MSNPAEGFKDLLSEFNGPDREPKARFVGVSSDWDMPLGLPTQTDDMSRLVYLLVQHKVVLPPMVRRVLPFGKELAELHHGVGAAGDVKELSHLYERGARLGEGSPTEVIQIILRLLDSSAAILQPTEKLSVYRDVELLHQELLRPKAPQEFVELDLSKDAESAEIPKFMSGFKPFDEIFGGFYQGLFVVMATPGTGKTSVNLSLMECLIKNGIPTWFFENEIPAGPMQGRISPLLRRTPFQGLGRFFCGPYNVDKIESIIRADPDPNRVVIFDSPDVQFGSVSGEKRLDLERDYQRLVLLKPLCKMIVVTSQPRRADAQLSMKSVADSWGKAWYADGMATVERSPSAVNSAVSLLMSKSVKNRFGGSNRSCYYHYNYETMEATMSIQDPNDDWEDY